MATSSNIDFPAILSYETVRAYSHLYIRSNVCKFTIILKIVYVYKCKRHCNPLRRFHAKQNSVVAFVVMRLVACCVLCAVVVLLFHWTEHWWSLVFSEHWLKIRIVFIVDKNMLNTAHWLIDTYMHLWVAFLKHFQLLILHQKQWNFQHRHRHINYSVPRSAAWSRNSRWVCEDFDIICPWRVKTEEASWRTTWR